MIKCGFSQRRKTIAQSISSQMNIEKSEIQSILKNMSLSETARIEQLDMNELIKLSEKLRNSI